MTWYVWLISEVKLWKSVWKVPRDGTLPSWWSPGGWASNMSKMFVFFLFSVYLGMGLSERFHARKRRRYSKSRVPCNKCFLSSPLPCIFQNSCVSGSAGREGMYCIRGNCRTQEIEGEWMVWCYWFGLGLGGTHLLEIHLVIAWIGRCVSMFSVR